MRVIKQGFNGGRISPSMHWSSDLQLHAKAHKELINWIPEVSEGVVRRSGSDVLLQLDPAFPVVEGFRARGLDFQYGETDFDTLLFHTDSRSALPTDPDDADTVLTIFNANGSQVFQFDGTDVPYKAGDLRKLAILQSFDAIYIYSGSHPTQRLTRGGELDWAIAPHAFNGGPWKLSNDDRTQVVSGKVSEWDNTVTYSEGDVVITGSSLNLSGTSANVFYNRVDRFDRTKGRRGYNLFYTRIDTSISPTSVSVGDKIAISNAVSGSNGDLNGEWTVARVDTTNNWIDLVTGTEQEVGGGIANDYSNNNLGSAVLFNAGERQVFHVSKQGSNLGNDPTTQPSDFWTQEDFLTAEITLTAINDQWTSDDVDRSFRLAADEVPRIYGNFTSTDEGEISSIVPVIGQVTLTTEGGIWDGEIALQLSIDGGATWEDIGVITSIDGSNNGSITRTITDFGGLVRAYMRERNAATSDSGCRYYISVDDPQFNYFTITSYVSATEVTAIPQNPMNSIPSTWRWSESVFGPTDGYPSNAVILDDTMIVSGVPGSPGTIYFSSLGDWTNWVTGSFTGAAFELVIGKDTRNVVQWMKSKESLLVGTDAGEWSIFPRDIDLALSLNNYRLERQAEYGSEDVPAITMGDVVVYVERGSFRVRALEGSIYDRGTFKSIDVSHKVPDWFRSTDVKQMAYLRSPVPTLWVLMENGKLYSWTFDPVNGVSGWAEQRIGGADFVYSISAAPGDQGDELFIVTNTGGQLVVQTIRYVNDMLDCLRVYTAVDENTLYYYEGGSDNPVVYDSAYIQNRDAVFMRSSSTVHPTAQIIQLVAEPTDFRVFLDGELQEEGAAYIRLTGSNNLHVLIPYTSGVLTFFDGSTQLTTPTDYLQFLGSQTTFIELTPDSSQVWAALTLEDGSGAVPAGEYLLQGNDTMIVPGRAYSSLKLTYNAGVDELVRNYEYRSTTVTQCWMMTGFANGTRRSRVIVGYEQENLVYPVDVLANLKLGGPGGTVRFKEIDLLVEESLGLQVRQFSDWADEEDEQGWMTIADLTEDAPVGRTLPLYTGVQRVDFASDTEYGGVNLQFRARGPRKSTISAMAVNLERIE